MTTINYMWTIYFQQESNSVLFSILDKIYPESAYVIEKRHGNNNLCFYLYVFFQPDIYMYINESASGDVKHNYAKFDWKCK